MIPGARPRPGAAAAARSLAVLAALCGLASCEPRFGGALLPNQLPEVELTAAPADSNGLYYYRYTLEWSLFDPDGRVDHCVYAVDPPEEAGADTAWVTTDAHRLTLAFAAGGPVSGPDSLRLSAAPHRFVIAAVDDRGAIGPRVHRSFFSFTQAPTVRITTPRPSNLTTAFVIPNVEITWTGDDPDGLRSRAPVRYKYLLIGPSSPLDPSDVLVDPSLLRRLYAPDFPASAGWVETDGATTYASFRNLPPGSNYLFVVVAFDEAGAYSPVFSLETNMLRMRVGYAGIFGPRLTLSGDFFSFTYASGGYSTDPQFWIPVEIASGGRVTFRWSAAPNPGAQIRHYRWSLDNQDLSDDRPRENEQTDLAHWSQPSATITSATVGPFDGEDPQHFFYVEAVDNIGLRSLGVISLWVVRATFERPLLVLDDTRRTPDAIQSNGEPAPPSGQWPTAAELDTFLYARGGVPWRNMPAGTLSPPGILTGYDFDTLGTRTGSAELTVPLAVLARYRHIVWITDGKSATFSRPGYDVSQPQTALRFMATPGKSNSLASYIAQGGLVWLLGGGGAYASQFPTNVGSNDRPTVTFSSTTGELGLGRFMYEFPRWRSEIRTATTTATVHRHTGRFEGTASPYTALPVAMELKAPSTDPLWREAPTRRASDFYLTTFEMEFLQKPNLVREVDEDSVAFSVLDSLYHLEGSSLPRDDVNPYNVAMTVYHGAAHPPVVFTGFNLWSFKREQCARLADAVLGGLWGLGRGPEAPARSSLRAAGAAGNGTVDIPRRAAPRMPRSLRRSP